MSATQDDEGSVTRTRCAGEKLSGLHLVVHFVDISLVDNDSGSSKATLKVRFDPLALGGERSNLIKIKMLMLEELYGQFAKYVHTGYLLDKLMFTRQGITDEKDCFKHLCIFESLLGPIFKLKGWWSMIKTNILKLKKVFLQKGETNKIKLSANAGVNDEEKEAFLLQHYQRFE